MMLALRWIVSVLSCFMFGCAGGLTSDVYIEAPPAESMSLVGRFGFAHACPVDGYIVTAAHVAEVSRQGSMVPLSYVYEQGTRRGFLTPNWVAASRDLATFRLDIGDEPLWYHAADGHPVEGDSLYWYQFSYKNVDVERVEGSVVKTVTGHITFRPAPVAGASGSCLFNEEGEVVGIVAWRIAEGTTESGFGPLLTGNWKPW